ncbi:hypothetical protein [Kingella bonacorsii]|nr:hypothetical protein [Kingella bonacorsii]
MLASRALAWVMRQPENQNTVSGCLSQSRPKGSLKTKNEAAMACRQMTD